jgi:biotin-dependent carboxylase-like uncharacterized protein
MITVLEAGALTLVEDRGRHGARAYGVATSGAFDELAALAANIAVGNAPDAAILEITLQGPVLRFEHDTVIAWTGGSATLELDGTTIAAGTPHEVPAGATLRCGRVTRGLRIALAIRGGIDVAPVLGSRSTHPAAELGPAPLTAGDRLPIGSLIDGEPRTVPIRNPSDTLRVVATIPWEPWTATVTTRTDRTGVRLDPLDAKLPEGGEIDPEPMLPGVIQLPPDGTPIVLGPDAPVTGGYRVIGVVARADRGHLAQARPGTALRFVPVEQAEAIDAWKDAVGWIASST